jgi:dolichol-phosphate mannosyltransferase
MSRLLPNVSIGISMPVLNEREGVKRIVPEIATALEGVDYTICIVDDGSTDGTVVVVQELIAQGAPIHLIQRVKTGFGCQRGAASRIALEWLVLHTTHDVLVEMDADGAQPAAELLNGARQVGLLDYDVAIASKYINGSVVTGRPLSRRLISMGYSWLARTLIDPTIRDYSNSFRFYRRDAAELLLSFTPRYASPVYLLEILVIWLSNNASIIEIPTVYAERAHGRSKVKLVDLVKGLLGTFDIARRFYLREYTRRESLSSRTGHVPGRGATRSKVRGSAPL